MRVAVAQCRARGAARACLPPTNEASSTRKHSREVRRKRREEIKSRTTGVGLSISTRASGSNKIVFGDNNSNDENERDDVNQDSAMIKLMISINRMQNKTVIPVRIAMMMRLKKSRVV